MADVARETAFRIGLDPVDRVVLMEDHDQAYYTWRDAGVKQRTLIHIDAHHDMWWVKDKAPITIADFICPALREDMVREVFWVVPDATWDAARGRRAILRHLKKIARKYPAASGAPKVGHDEISVIVLGKKVRVCSLRSLLRIDESVLLDIDVDFLVIPRVTYGEIDEHGALPWCWPDELLARLTACQIRADLVTIVYSVEGGYTPLKWKYLGAELASRLGQPNTAESGTEGFGLIREASVAAEKGDTVAAEEKYQRAACLLATSAAPHFHLAHLYAKLGRIEECRRAYQRALELDPSYRTAYNSAGFRYYWDGRFQEAEKEHLRTLALDPDDAYAHLGLGQLAARNKRWKEAETLLSRSLALNDHLIDSYRELGNVLARQPRYDEAIRAYERSLKLALAGHKPMNGPLLTQSEQPRLLDPDHSLIHARLAHLYMKKGAIAAAISAYRLSAGGGNDGVGLRVRLASLYLKQGQKKKAAAEAWRAVKLFPTDLQRMSRTLRNLPKRVRRFVVERGRTLLSLGPAPG